MTHSIVKEHILDVWCFGLNSGLNSSVITIITVKLLVVAKADHQQLIIWQFCFWAAQQVERE